MPESIRLRLAKKAVVDSNTSQWLSTVYSDLTGYEQFKEAITDLLLWPQTQAKLRCSLYQSKYDRAKDGPMFAHFLRYSSVAANLSPRLSEVDIVEAITVHFAPYNQRTLSSANVRAIRNALGLLNILDSMEANDSRLTKSNQ
jgi:hypothetical protein